MLTKLCDAHTTKGPAEMNVGLKPTAQQRGPGITQLSHKACGSLVRRGFISPYNLRTKRTKVQIGNFISPKLPKRNGDTLIYEETAICYKIQTEACI